MKNLLIKINLFIDLIQIVLKGGEIMSSLVYIYVSLIVDGYKTFSQVPANLKPYVKAELERMGLGELAQ